ncbi:polyprenyl synthetase family protein [Mesoaciditoga sp.]
MKVTDEILREFVLSMDINSTLKKAAIYTLTLPGKRLRPTLLLASAKDFGVDERDALKAAVAIEMMHAASLIHDDLPAIDNDGYRRGKPSNHVVFGENFAILAGDFLFAKALDLCNEIGNLRLSEAFSKTLLELIDGEARDVFLEKKSVEVDEILKMYRKKTGALFAFAFSFGPRMSGKMEKKYEEAGYSFGLSFQILDDVLDLTSTFEKMGKTPHKDDKQQKSTLVSKIGLEDSKKYADTLYGEVIEKIKDSPNLLEEVKKVKMLLEGKI